jgi:hypothetical protein
MNIAVLRKLGPTSRRRPKRGKRPVTGRRTNYVDLLPAYGMQGKTIRTGM